MQSASKDYHLQVVFQDREGRPMVGHRYRLQTISSGNLEGVTNAQGATVLLETAKTEGVMVWYLPDGLRPVPVKNISTRPKSNKPQVVARLVQRPMKVTATMQPNEQTPVTYATGKPYCIMFKVDFDGAGKGASYRLVQNGVVVHEGKTPMAVPIYLDRSDPVDLYFAGDKRYKKGEAYTPEMRADDGTVILPFTTAKPYDASGSPTTDRSHAIDAGAFNKRDWVDVSVAYNYLHPDVTPAIAPIYQKDWTPAPVPGQKWRRLVTQVSGHAVEIYWQTGFCDGALFTQGRTTHLDYRVPDYHWYMTPDEAIARTHPKVYQVLFDVIRATNLSYVEISCCWRPHLGSAAHREGRALDIVKVKRGTTSVVAKDFLPNSQVIDTTGSPSGNEPALIEEVRQALYNHPLVTSIISPWHGMFAKGSAFNSSFTPSYAGEQGIAKTFKTHRDHLHFHIRLD